MTPREYEIQYRTTERLGILIGKNTPTQEQQEMADREAIEAVEKLTEEDL